LNSVWMKRVSWGVRERFAFYLSWHRVGGFKPDEIEEVRTY